MNMDEYLDALGDLVDDAWTMPLTGGKAMVDAGRIREIIEDIRLAMPTEIKQAKMIVADRADIIAKAKAEADYIVRNAEERAKAMLNHEEILKQAQARATELLEQAQQKAREMRRAATDFAETMLKNTEETLVHSLTEVKQARSALKIPKKTD